MRSSEHLGTETMVVSPGVRRCSILRALAMTTGSAWNGFPSPAGASRVPWRNPAAMYRSSRLRTDGFGAGRRELLRTDTGGTSGRRDVDGTVRSAPAPAASRPLIYQAFFGWPACAGGRRNVRNFPALQICVPTQWTPEHGPPLYEFAHSLHHLHVPSGSIFTCRTMMCERSPGGASMS